MDGVAVHGSSSSSARSSSASRLRAATGLELGIALFAALHLALAVTMALAPHTFYTAVGPFGGYNGHYIRDIATFYAALGGVGALSLARASWRAPVLAVLLAQYALHSVNHLVDITSAHPAWTGYFDFASLAAATLVLAGMLRAALHADGAAAPHADGAAAPHADGAATGRPSRASRPTVVSARSSR